MIKRRDMLKQTAALVGGSVLPWTIGAGVASIGQNAHGAQGPPRIPAGGAAQDDLALINGKFVDGRGNITTALAIRNGRITGVGPEKEPDADVAVVDLGGRTVVPGLFDSHVHYARAGVNPGYEARGIERAFSIRDLQEAIVLRAKTVPAGAFITCIGGWNHLQFVEARRPTKAELDDAAPGHAVYLSATGADTGAMTNGRGETILTSRGVKVDAATGRVGAPDEALAALRGVQTADDRRRATAELNAHANALGLTAVKNSGNLDDLELTLELWRRGTLSVRMRPTFPAGSPA